MYQERPAARAVLAAGGLDEKIRKTVAELFSGEFKAMDVLKWKDVIEELEHGIDGLQKLSNIIESTVLKHA